MNYIHGHEIWMLILLYRIAYLFGAVKLAKNADPD